MGSIHGRGAKIPQEAELLSLRAATAEPVCHNSVHAQQLEKDFMPP